MDRTPYQQADFDAGHDCMKYMFESMRTLNNSHFIQGMLQAFQNEHRTNQATLIRQFKCFLEVWTNIPRSDTTDLRNESAYDWAIDALKSQQQIPFI